MVDPSQLAAWIGAAKGSIDLVKVAAGLLPKSEKKDEIEQKLIDAERALAASNAKLAQELNYKLCQCTFPPQIMLWSNVGGGFFCPNTDCGEIIMRPKPMKASFRVSTRRV
jgi:hypothetical protein